jgi:hypothetical protein
MKILTATALGALTLAAAGPVLADASYQQTSQITGGSLVQTMQSVSFLSKQIKDLTAPNNSLTMIHGNQKAVVNRDSSEIVDLDKETITHIDSAKKTYSVVTFAQMRQAMASMPDKIAQAQAQAKAAQQQAQASQPKSDLKTSFEVDVKNTGATKNVNGLSAQEQLVTMKMHVTDPNGAGTEAQNTVTYVVTTDMWITPDPPEIKEVRDFDMRMGQKMMQGVDISKFSVKPADTSAALAPLLGSKPGATEALVQMGKEMAKVKGTRVMVVTRMGGEGGQPAAASAGSPGAGSSAVGDASQAAGQAAVSSSQGAASSAAGEAVAEHAGSGVTGGILGSAAGAFSGKLVGGLFSHKSTPTPAATATPAAQGGAVLMEQTMQMSNFSHEAIPPSAFEVPAGFKLVPSPFENMGK